MVAPDLPGNGAGASVPFQAGDITGVVTDRSGRALERARCQLIARAAAGGFFPGTLLSEPRAVATTDAGGRFRLQPGTGEWVLQIDLPGFARRQRDSVRVGDFLRIVLDPEVRLTVTVVDPSGSPVEGADVCIYPAWEDEPSAWSSRLRTDPNGRASTGSLAPGAWWVSVRHSQHAATAVPLEIPTGLGRVDREIILEGGARLVGVVRSEEGHPIPGAHVRIESPYRRTLLLVETATDERGRYTTDPIFSSMEMLEVLVSAQDHAESTEWPGIQPADVSKGEAVQDFVLARSGLALHGRVVNEETSALVGVSVRIAPIDLSGTSPDDTLAVLKVAPRAPWLWQEVARTDARGIFDLPSLAAQREYALLLVHPDYAPRIVWCPPSDRGTTKDLGDIELAAFGGLWGRARFEDGTPAEGQVIVIGKASRIYYSDRHQLGGWRPDSWFHVMKCPVDEGGLFRFDRIAPGTYQFVSVKLQAEVLPGPVTGPIEVVLEGGAGGPQAELTGLVLDQAGERLPMVFVRAFAVQGSGERLVASSLTDGNGSFSLRVPAGGGLRLSVTDLHGKYEIEELRLPAPPTDLLEVALQPRAVPLPPLDGLVLDPRSAALEGCAVTLHPPEDALCGCITFQRKTDAAGTFRFSVADGPHRLVASDPRYASASHAPAWPGDHVLLELEER